MSIINSDGLNTNWQLNVLRGLQAVADQLTGITVDTDDIELLLAAQTRVPDLIRHTGPTPATIAVKVYDFSVANVGSANGTILGQTIKPGETLNFSAGSMNNFYAAGTITYNGNGTELVIIYNT
jgi:sulfur carrier protein ThiS